MEEFLLIGSLALFGAGAAAMGLAKLIKKNKPNQDNTSADENSDGPQHFDYKKWQKEQRRHRKDQL